MAKSLASVSEPFYFLFLRFFLVNLHIHIKYTWTRTHTKRRHMSTTRLLFNKQRLLNHINQKIDVICCIKIIASRFAFTEVRAHQTLNEMKWNEIGCVRNHAVAMNSFVSPFYFVGWMICLPPSIWWQANVRINFLRIKLKYSKSRKGMCKNWEKQKCGMLKIYKRCR